MVMLDICVAVVVPFCGELYHGVLSSFRPRDNGVVAAIVSAAAVNHFQSRAETNRSCHICQTKWGVRKFARTSLRGQLLGRR